MRGTTRMIPLALALGLFAGCSKGAKTEDFTPSADKARQALEAGLTHLKGGNAPGAVPGTTPRVEVVDSKLKAGQLAGFEVLGEEPVSGATPRFFKVRLTLAKGSPVETKYAVFGIDPLLVYREEDYHAMSGTGGAGK